MLHSHSNVWEIYFLHILPAFDIVTIYYFSCSVKYIMISHCDHSLHFPNASNVEHLLMWLFAIHISSLVKCFFIYFACFLIGLFGGFFSVEFNLYILDIIPVRYVVCVVCKYFLPVCGLSFHPINRIFCRAKVLSFDDIQFIDWVFPLWTVLLVSCVRNSSLSPES